jgi:hypothetical protein
MKIEREFGGAYGRHMAGVELRPLAGLQEDPRDKLVRKEVKR